MNIDIKFIAQKAGVSIATVSRVINKSKKVSPELEKRVMEQINKHNYRPNTLARGLILNRTNLIGVIVPNVSNIYHAKMLSLIESYAEKFDYSVIVANVSSDFEKQKNTFRIFHERCVDGILLLHENTKEELDELVTLVKVPVILVSVSVPDCQLPSVGINEEQAAFDAASYLIRIGHRKISGIFSESYSLGVLRKKGFLKAMEKSQIDIIPSWIFECDCTIEDGELTATKLLELREIPTAIFCVSDEIAIGVMNSLFIHGYDVPKDISVIGFDNINLSRIIRPNLSTVDQPIEEIAKNAVMLMHNTLSKVYVRSNNIQLNHHLVLRNSCRSLNGRF